MKKKIAVAASAVLAVVLLSGFRGGGWGFHRDPERIKQMITWRLNDKLEDIDATEGQKQAVQGVKDRLFEDGKRLAEEHQATRLEVLTQLESDAPDAQKLHGLVDARIDAARAFAHKVVDAALEVHRVFTPEQRKQLATEYREKMDIR
ncbi:Spy/CpxP family protein refolding chaperone [Hyalangium gracile]|uniref:Spy/CpxP family protein refolding chaperone n=1 Tax=Hyalangium gracile TaxID=394092 RepID=UPI001CCE1E53|nr:Spy/CpxP family protein refolding chaperone [Hyalangium gracile]